MSTRCGMTQLLFFLVLSCLALLSAVQGSSDAGWNLPPKTTAVVTGGTKGIGKVSSVGRGIYTDAMLQKFLSFSNPYLMM